MKTTISVIIPTFNRVHFLGKAIESVLEQSYEDFELIVIDDGSTDSTNDLISSFHDPRIKYFYQDNQGTAAAKNLGIKNAKGEFLAFLDSDDYWEEKKLELQVNAMLANPDFPISHTQEIWYRREELLDQKKKHTKYHGYIFDKCLPICAVGMSTMMVRKELFETIGLFDESMPCCEDYDIWLRTSIAHPFLLVDEPLTIKHGGREDQLSTQHRIGIDKYRIYSLEKILNPPFSLSSEQRALTITELIKKCRIYGNGCVKHGKNDEGEYYLGLIEKYMKNRDKR